MASTACADSLDFKTDGGGRLQLNPHTYQSSLQTFSRVLAGVNGTYEQVTEMTPVVVTVAGLYLVTWDGHGNFVNPSPGLGSLINGSIMCGLGLNAAFVGGSETMISSLNQGTSSVDQPSMGSEGSGSGSRVIQLAAGASLSLWAAWRRSASSVATVLSNSDGRCRITAVRIAG